MKIKKLTSLIRHHLQVIIFFILVFINIVSASTWFYLNHNSKYNFSFHYKNKEIFISTNENSYQWNNYKEITDSVLSILKSYYVDKDKIIPLELGHLIFKNLKENPLINVYEKTNSYNVSIANNSKTFHLSENMDFHELKSLIIDLAFFIHQNVYSNNTNNVTANDNNDNNTYAGLHLVLNTLLSNLDPHSNILNKQEYKELLEGTQGVFGGLGLLVGIRDGVLTVIKPLPKSPALMVGIKSQDKILQINDINTFGLSLDTLINYMRGEPGTEVTLSILRENDFAPRQLKLKRELIQLNSLEYKIIENATQKNKILYLKLESFNNTTVDEIYQTFLKVKKEHSPMLTGIILDLRNNPGGLLEQAIRVANLFLQEGMIVSVKGRKTFEEKAYQDDIKKIDLPLIVLVNQYSASASEIVAAALQENKRALVVGQPTFGKGSVQTVFELPQEQGLKLTVARYYTPTKRSIQNVGIIPDITIYPIYQKSQNYNLLGSYKYKKESSLKNHLLSLEEDLNLQKNNNLYFNSSFEQSSFITGYYLTNEEKDLLDINDYIASPECEIAKTILFELYRIYEGNIPNYAQRSHHWLILAAKKINAYIKDLTNNAQNWLKAKHNIDWTSAEEQNLSFINNLENLHFQIYSETSQAMPGNKIKIKWTLYNNGNIPIERLAIFAFSQNISTNSAEVLVGKIYPYTKLSGTIEFQIPFELKEKFLKLKLGVSHNNKVIQHSINTIIINIVKQQIPLIGINLKLTHESKHNDKILEDYENAIAEFEIYNNSSISLKNLQMKCINLAGKQLHIDSPELNIFDLPKLATKKIQIPISAKQILSSELNIGVIITGDNIGYEIKNSISIKGSKSFTQTSVESLAH